MRLCPSCEAENDDGSRFCTNCHDYLDWAGGKRAEPTRAPPFEAPPPAEPVRAAEPPPASPPQAPGDWAAPPAATVGPAVQHEPAALYDAAVPNGPAEPKAAHEPVGPHAPPLSTLRFPAARVPVPPQPVSPQSHNSPRRIPTTVRELAPGSGLVARPPEVASGMGLRAAKITPVRPDQQPLLVPAHSAPAVVRDEPEIPGGQVCKVCRRSSPPERRFCACGATLMRRDVAASPAQRAGAADRPRSVKGFRAGLRAAAGGRPRFDRPVAVRVRAMRFLLIAGLLVLAGSQLTPGGIDARHWTTDRAKSLVPKHYQEISLTAADVDQRKGEIDGYEPFFAIDGEPSRAWAVHVVRVAQPGKCGSATSTALIVKLKGPTSVDRIVLHAGLPSSDNNRVTFQIPRLVDVTFSDGTCDRLRLDKTNGAQDFPVDVGAVESMRIQVAAAYPATEGPGGTAAIAEVQLQRG
jgi:hypothetical protein